MSILARIRAARVISLLMLLSAPAAAQQTQAPAEPVTQAPRVTAAQMEQLRDDLRAGVERLAPLIGSVDVSAAEAWLAASPLESIEARVADAAPDSSERAVWQEAAAHEKAGMERLRGALDRAALALSGAERLEEAARRVEEMLAVAPRELDAESTPSDIESLIASLNSRRVEVALELDQRRATLTRLEEQLRGQTQTLDRLRRDREQELANAAANQNAADPALAEGRAASAAALERRAQARILAAQLDLQTMPPRIERLRMEVRAHELEGRWLGQRLAVLREEFNQRSTEELRELSASLQRLIEREPEVRERLAESIAVLRGQIDQIAATQNRIQALQLDREERLRVENDLTQTLANVRERLEIGGLSETLGSLFLEEQRRLRALDDERFELGDIERELAQSRLRNISLREQLNALPAPDAGIADESAQAELRRLRHETLTTLVQTEESLTEQLRQTEVSLRALVSLVDELDQILRETLLWWPSHVPVSFEWLMRVPAALIALLDPESWQETRSAAMAVTVGSPASSLFVILVAALVYRGGRGTRRHLRDLAEKTRHRFTDNIKLTFKAMGWSLLRVLPVPVLLFSTAYRLQQIPGTGPGVEILAAVLFSGAIWWLVGHLFLLFTGRNGVGTVHFQWDPYTVRRLRRNLAWYLPIQFMLIICLALAFGHPSDLVFDVLGRAALVASGVLSGMLAWRLLTPNPDRDAASPGARRRRLIRLAAVTYAAALVALALAGYLLTVRELLERTIDTAVVLGLVYLVYRLAVRALILSEMRLRVRRRLEQRAQEAALEGNVAVGEGAQEIGEPHLSMEDINAQTRTLVDVTAGGAMVLALGWVWADILPALTWLDGITLWSRSVTIGEAEIMSSISLQDGLLAVFLGVLFMMAARNLPGLVEIILTRGSQMDAAGRYTVSTLLRYALMVVAVISVFALLGLRWSELQWLVAALTLGLGFGLQEVVANFFSGIIMLFERPVRVGDTITIGEFSGTVARIRTRATTIMDWDNREIVVPNKMFITERLINWTLSDTMTRIILPVGVSYDADVDIVMRRLREIADEHPRVMKDPEPAVLFMRFGDSALNFELRAYVDQLQDRLTTLSELHQAIIRDFRARGIQIAFPQMDLHIRDLPSAAQSHVQAAAVAANPLAPQSPASAAPAAAGPSGSA